MGIGPKMKCDKCGASFYGGKGYAAGSKNFCYDCIVNMTESISEADLNSLGETQKGFIGLIQKMGGMEAAGGKTHWSNLLKKNAGEIDEIPVNTEDDVEYIMDMLEKFNKTYKNRDGHSYLVGGLDSYIYPEKLQEIAEKYHFQKHKSFHISDKSILDEVKRYVSGNRMVVVIAWTKEDRIDVWLDREVTSTSKSSQKGDCFIATAVYESYSAPEVILLRRFRDDVLTESILGRMFILLYYKFSPYWAKKISTHENLKKFIKIMILDKLVSKLS